MSGRATARRVVAAVLCLIPLGWLIVTALTVGPRLGSEMASHWSDAGRPDGFADTWLAFWILAALVTVLTAGAIGLVVASSSSSARVWAGLVVGFAGVAALAWAVPAESTAAAGSPEEAELGVRMLLLIPVAALGVLVFGVLRSVPVRVDEEPLPVTAQRLRAGDRLVWSGTTGSAWFGVPALALLGGAVCCLVVALVGEAPGLIAPAVFLLLIGSALLMVANVRLLIDARGVRLLSTVFRIPLIRVALDDIAAVSTERIEPLRWGGWGFRVSGRGVAYVTHRSRGLVITRQRGTSVAITIADAERASEAVALLVDQRRAAAS